MTDDPTIATAAYHELLDGHAWIRSRDADATLCRGWVRLVAEMLAEMDLVVARLASDHPGLAATRWTTKEKLGQLRVHFGLAGGTAEAWRALREPVDRAEEASTRTCERCGARGWTRDVGGWLSTLCDAHAAERRAARRSATGRDPC